MRYCIVLLSLVVISESTFNNSCLLKDLNKQNIPSKSFDCPAFVLKSTDEIWNGDSTGVSLSKLIFYLILLRERCRYSELFWSASVRMQENTDQNNSDTFYAVIFLRSKKRLQNVYFSGEHFQKLWKWNQWDNTVDLQENSKNVTFWNHRLVYLKSFFLNLPEFKNPFSSHSFEMLRKLLKS